MSLVDAPIASTSALPDASAPEEKQIAIRLTTKDSLYSIPATKFLVPASWRRFHLSELINKVLENEKPIPFDFLVSSTLLRSSLASYCASEGISEEVTLEIEYLPSTLPPQLDSQIPSEDWVSDVSLGLDGAILTSSYASTLSLHSSFSGKAATFVGHDLSTLSCCYVRKPSDEGEGLWVASGGMDRVARVWEFDNDLYNPTPTTAPKTLYTLSLHTAPISSIRSHSLSSTSTSSPHLITAGWDGLIGLWDLTKGVNEGEGADVEGGERKKKRKKADVGGIVNKSPIAVLRGHAGKVSTAIFDRLEANKAFSAGTDHSVREWDLETVTEVTSKTSDKHLLSLAQPSSRNLLITGSTDRFVSVWDLRDTSQNISLSLPGHLAPVSSVAAHPTAPLMFASGSYDSTVRVWDARSTKQALFVLPLPGKDGEEVESGKGEKVRAVDWDGRRLVAGGEGARVVCWRVDERGVKKDEVVEA